MPDTFSLVPAEELVFIPLVTLDEDGFPAAKPAEAVLVPSITESLAQLSKQKDLTDAELALFYMQLQSLLSKFHTYAKAFPSSNISRFRVFDSRKEQCDTAYWHMLNKTLNIALSFLQAINFDILGIEAVVGHETGHSSFTTSWLEAKQMQGIRSLLLNHLEDWRLNTFLVRNFPHLREGFDVVYTAAFRNGNRQYQITENKQQFVLWLWHEISQRSFYPNFETQVDLLLCKTVFTPVQSLLLARLKPHIIGFQRCQPDFFDRELIKSQAKESMAHALRIFEILEEEKVFPQNITAAQFLKVLKDLINERKKAEAPKDPPPSDKKDEASTPKPEATPEKKDETGEAPEKEPKGEPSPEGEKKDAPKDDAKPEGKPEGKPESTESDSEEDEKTTEKPDAGEPGAEEPADGEPEEGAGAPEPGAGEPTPGAGAPADQPSDAKSPGEGSGKGEPGAGEPGAESGEAGTGEPGAGKPGEGKPSDGKPGEGTGEAGESGEGESSAGATSDNPAGKPGEAEGEATAGAGKDGKPSDSPAKGTPSPSPLTPPEQVTWDDLDTLGTQELEALRDAMERMAGADAGKPADAKEETEEELRQVLRDAEARDTKASDEKGPLNPFKDEVKITAMANSGGDTPYGAFAGFVDPVDVTFYEEYMKKWNPTVGRLVRLFANAKAESSMEQGHKMRPRALGHRLRIKAVVRRLANPACPETKLFNTREGDLTRGHAIINFQDVLMGIDSSGSMSGIIGVAQCMAGLIYLALQRAKTRCAIASTIGDRPYLICKGNKLERPEPVLRRLGGLRGSGDVDMANGSIQVLHGLQRPGSNPKLSRLVIFSDCCAVSRDMIGVATTAAKIGYPICVIALTRGNYAQDARRYMPNASFIQYGGQTDKDSIMQVMETFARWMADPDSFYRTIQKDDGVYVVA